MKKSILTLRNKIIATLLAVLIISLLSTCTGTKKNQQVEMMPEIITTSLHTTGPQIELNFKKGKYHNHPLMAIWIETMDGQYITTLYVAKSIAKGVFEHGDKSRNYWQPGEIRRPAALPYWSHKRGVVEADGLYIPTAKTPMPDAVTSATPKADFVLISQTGELPSSKFRLLMEINQTWDWNEYWTNNKYPDDENYKTSCQPSLIYAAEIDLDNLQAMYELKPIGHGHYSGQNGELYPDLSTLTTALHIAEKVTAVVKK